jgi:hypothetical protein
MSVTKLLCEFFTFISHPIPSYSFPPRYPHVVISVNLLLLSVLNVRFHLLAMLSQPQFTSV